MPAAGSAAARRACGDALRICGPGMIDGLTCNVMMGITETLFVGLRPLPLGMGQVVAGLVASVPILAGAFLQLVSPRAIRLLGSNRRWVVLCVVFQAISFLPLAVTALIGQVPVAVLFLLSAMYWGSGLASGPAWKITGWIRLRSRARSFEPTISAAGSGCRRPDCCWDSRAPASRWNLASCSGVRWWHLHCCISRRPSAGSYRQRI